MQRKCGQDHVISCRVTSNCLLLRGGELEDVPKKGTEQISEMAEAQSNKEKGGRYCVAGGHGKTSCKNTSYSAGIKMHQFLLDPRVKKKWIKFVQRHWPTFKDPKKYTSLCSVHFQDSCYYRP